MGRPRRLLSLEEKREANRLRQQRFRDKRRRQAAGGQNGEAVANGSETFGGARRHTLKQFEMTWRIIHDAQLQEAQLRCMQPGIDDGHSNNLTQPSTSGFSLSAVKTEPLEEEDPDSITPDLDEDSDTRYTLPPASQFCEVSLKEPTTSEDTVTITKNFDMPVSDNDVLTDLNVKQLHKLAPQLLEFKWYVKCTKFGLRLVMLHDDCVVVTVEITATQDGCRTMIKVLGKELPRHHPITELLGSPSNVREIVRFVEKLEDWNLCPGNPAVGSSVPNNAQCCSRTGAVYSNQCLGLVLQEKCYNCQQCALNMVNS